MALGHRLEIYVAKADGSGVTRLTRLPGPDLSPAWSSDGRRLVWSHDAEIWTMSASGAGKRRLVRREKRWHEHCSPTWHGSRIVYASSRVSAFDTELFEVPAKRLTFTQGADGTLGDDSHAAARDAVDHERRRDRPPPPHRAAWTPTGARSRVALS